MDRGAWWATGSHGVAKELATKQQEQVVPLIIKPNNIHVLFSEKARVGV